MANFLYDTFENPSGFQAALHRQHHGVCTRLPVQLTEVVQ